MNDPLRHQAVLSGARILLVEDNLINREVALEILSSADIVVSIASNGQEALDLLQQQSFDGVLMDCQMPVLDGYAATRALRQQPHLRELPVIAMTADAMPADRARVLAAGMNDHIAKPINIDEMFATLARWVRPAGTTKAAAKVDRRAELLTLPGIDGQAGLAGLMNDATLYRRLLCMFRDRESDFPRRFSAARASGAVEAARRMAHDLKSVGGTLGMTALERAAGALERACEEGIDDRDIDVLESEVARLLEPVIAGLKGLERVP